MISSSDTGAHLTRGVHRSALNTLNEGASSSQIAVNFEHALLESLLRWPSPIDALEWKQSPHIAESLAYYAQLLRLKLECELGRRI
jgi:hypothetical protein